MEIKTTPGIENTSEKKKPTVIANDGFLIGAGCRNRTGYLMITSQLLYQVS